jgi:hypothetical protein
VRLQQEGFRSGVFAGCKFNALERAVHNFQRMYAESLK